MMAGEAERALASFNAALERGEKRIGALSPDLDPEERAASVISIRDDVLQGIAPHHRMLEAVARRASGTEKRAAKEAERAGRLRLTAFLRGSTTLMERIASHRAAAPYPDQSLVRQQPGVPIPQRSLPRSPPWRG